MKKGFTIDPTAISGLTVAAAVARERSFTRAAAALGVSTSAVSQRVRELETALGVGLFSRSTRSVALTEAGERLFARVRPALAEIDAAAAAAAEGGEGPSGVLRVTASAIAARLVLHPRLAAFHAACPDVLLEVSSDEGLSDLVREGFDAGIRLGEALAQDVVAVPVSPPQRLAVVGTPAYFAAHGKPRTPRDLRAHACIGYRYQTKGTLYRWELTEGRRELRVDVHGPLVTNDNATMLAAARAGLGLAQTFESAVADELAAGTLVRVLDAYCPPFPGFFLYYRRAATTPRRLAALVEVLHVRARRR